MAPLKPDAARPVMPPIIGTGFIVDDGLIVTNKHVVDALETLPRPAGSRDWPFAALLMVPEPGGLIQVSLEVLGVFIIGDVTYAGTGHRYGPKIPDMAFVHVKARGLPTVPVDSSAMPLEEGRRVATAGWPLGTSALTAPGYLHQLVPILQEGIISAVLPFPCAAPHAFMINVMVHGGASGSPVFALHVPAVLGVLYAGLTDTVQSAGGDLVETTTPYSYVVPAHFLEHALRKIRGSDQFALPSDTLTLDAMLATYHREEMFPRGEDDTDAVAVRRLVAARTPPSP